MTLGDAIKGHIETIEELRARVAELETESNGRLQQLLRVNELYRQADQKADIAEAALAGERKARESELELESGQLSQYLTAQWDWSKRTFGSGRRTRGILQHITKELLEIEAKPDDLSEWVDVAMIAMDGYCRHGGKPTNLMGDLLAKQRKNFSRNWPTPTSEDIAVEHDRTGESESLQLAIIRERKAREEAEQRVFKLEAGCDLIAPSGTLRALKGTQCCDPVIDGIIGSAIQQVEQQAEEIRRLREALEEIKRETEFVGIRTGAIGTKQIVREIAQRALSPLVEKP